MVYFDDLFPRGGIIKSFFSVVLPWIFRQNSIQRKEVFDMI